MGTMNLDLETLAVCAGYSALIILIVIPWRAKQRVKRVKREEKARALGSVIEGPWKQHLSEPRKKRC